MTFLHFKNDLVKICLAEFFGTFLLLYFGDSGVAQTVLYEGSFLTIGITWTIGLFAAISVAAKISGAHVNPAVTICVFIFDKKFRTEKIGGFSSKIKVAAYIISQFLGAFVGAALTYLQYYNAINNEKNGFGKNGSTAGIFATYPKPTMSIRSAFFVEFFTTAILVTMVFACGDKNQFHGGDSKIPVGLWTMPLILLGIGQSFGQQTGFAINPARDLGPRVFTWMVGYPNDLIWYFPEDSLYASGEYYFWIPVVAPILGAVFGGFIYQIFVGDQLSENDETENNAENDLVH